MASASANRDSRDAHATRQRAQLPAADTVLAMMACASAILTTLVWIARNRVVPVPATDEGNVSHPTTRVLVPRAGPDMPVG